MLAYKHRTWRRAQDTFFAENRKAMMCELSVGVVQLLCRRAKSTPICGRFRGFTYERNELDYLYSSVLNTYRY